MALSKEKKADVVAETAQLLKDSKLTVVATYEGTPVKSLQQLRRDSREHGTTVRVVKNRLFKKALTADDRFKNVDFDFLSGQLLYAFNPSDEVAPAQDLASFAKSSPQVKFVSGLTGEGQILSAEDVTALANLPSKEQLRAQLMGTIGAPLSGFANVLAGNVRGVLNVLTAREQSLS